MTQGFTAAVNMLQERCIPNGFAPQRVGKSSVKWPGKSVTVICLTMTKQFAVSFA